MEKRIIVDYKRKTDGHIYSVSYPITTFTSINDDGTCFHSMSNNKLWKKFRIRKVIKITKLQNEILKLMEEDSGFNNPEWGFSAMGFREVAKILNLNAISVSNSMRDLNRKGVFFSVYSYDQWDDARFFLANPYLSDKKGNAYDLY